MYFASVLFLLSSIASSGIDDVAALVTVPTSDCGANPIDIHIILDNGRTIGGENFDKMRRFVWDFVSTFEIGPDKTQIGLHTYGKYIYQMFWLNTHTTKESLLQAVEEIPFSNDDLRYLGLAFEEVSSQAFLPAHGGRDGVMNVIIVFTDGEVPYNDSVSQINASTLAALSTHARVIVVDIGDSSPSTLVAVDSDSTRHIHVDCFDELEDILEELRRKTCEVCPFWSETDAEVVDRKCIRLMNSSLAQEDAEAACETDGPNVTLAKLTSSAVRDYVANKTSEMKINAWLSGTDAAEEGTWLWSAGGGPMNIDPAWWGVGWNGLKHPDNWKGNEDCLEMRKDGKLNDRNCQKKLPYFCQSADILP